MSKRFLLLVTGVAVVGSVVLMGAGFPTAKKVPPKQWAGKVCTAVGDWVEVAQDGSEDLQASLSDTSDISYVRDVLAGYLNDVADGTDVVAAKIKKAGVPDTPKGKQAQAALTRGFRTIGDGVGELAAEAEAIDTADPVAALDQITAIEGGVATAMDLDAAFGDLDRLDPGNKLNRAFSTARSCRSLSG